ncbi:hypothetical protein FNJ84_19015 [Paracoccus sp. M683]|uniref:hypothetical protein n=1 Tax=Paracoccus sp. M683 TaxID=2594268 RepID=UPI0011810882|nr:hypothetical protein [Paracoccus sp. M683]TRW94587.1 hypothetical protein FNJ84_19015 [Paracoccus sp. M683]
MARSPASTWETQAPVTISDAVERHAGWQRRPKINVTVRRTGFVIGCAIGDGEQLQKNLGQIGGGNTAA